jgi:hypothetical protein
VPCAARAAPWTMEEAGVSPDAYLDSLT